MENNNVMQSATDGSGYGITKNNSRLAEDSAPVKYSPDFYYDMTGVKKLLIFNHFTYKESRYRGQKTPSNRNGTFQDVKRLRKVFENLNFEVTVYQDLYYEEIIDAVIKVSAEDPASTSCVAVAILTHGSSGGGLCAYDQTYNLKDILIPFLSAECTLINKPKLFFIQACRGDLVDEGRVMYDGPDDSLLLPTHADFLIMYSTVEDFVSWRDANGSWMVQELCDVIEKHSDTLDLLQMITLVNNAVAYNRISKNTDQTLNKKKATPETQFTLTKFLRF